MERASPPHSNHLISLSRHLDMRPRTRAGSTWTQCAKRCYKDWLLLLVLLVVLPFSEEGTTARRMYITESMLEQIKFPFYPSTVPSWSVPMYSLLAPSLTMIAHGHWTGQTAATMHACTLGALTSTILSADITNIFKIQVCPSSTDVARPWLGLAEACFADRINVFFDLYAICMAHV
jgi:hypothetical protein